MKAKIVLSVAAALPNKVQDSVLAELLVLDMSANVTSIVSVIGRDIGTRARIEDGVSVDILDFEHLTDILVLWKRLRDVLKIGCVWLEVYPYDGLLSLPYKGCICDWPVYLAHPEIVGPGIIKGTK